MDQDRGAGTVNYYELKKQATIQPWTVDECPDALEYYTIRRHDGTPNGNTREYPVATVFRETDAQLIAHCVNNFDQALSVLKKCRTCLEMAGIGPSPELVQTIKEMENE